MVVAPLEAGALNDVSELVASADPPARNVYAHDGANALSPEAALGILTKLTHQCGGNFGKKVSVEHIQKEKKP